MVLVRGFLAAVLLLTVGSGSLWAESGAQVFKEQCAKCHGDAGKSDTSMGKKMKIPPIAGDAKIAATSDEDLVKEILAAEKHPKGVKNMSAADAAAAAAHVKGLASAK
jgi:cytochrome c